MTPEVVVIDASFGAVPLDVHAVRAERTVLVDAGPATAELVPALESGGVEPELLAITHAHEDHVGGAEPLRQRYPELEVAIHHDDVAWAECASLFWEQVYLRHRAEWEPDDEQKTAVLELRGEGTSIQLVLEDGDRLDGAGLVALAAPSHTPGHVVYWQEEVGALLVGDALQGAGVRLREGPGVFPLYLDVPAYCATLDRLETLGAEVFYTSHFGVLRGAAATGLIRRSRAFVEELHELVLGLLPDEPRRLRDLAPSVQRSYPDFGGGMQLYATTHAHLRQLEAEGEAVSSTTDGVEEWVRA